MLPVELEHVPEQPGRETGVPQFAMRRQCLPHAGASGLCFTRKTMRAITWRRASRFEAGEHLAQKSPGAVWHPLEGADHFWWCGDSPSVIQAIPTFAVP